MSMLDVDESGRITMLFSVRYHAVVHLDTGPWCFFPAVAAVFAESQKVEESKVGRR